MSTAVSEGFKLCVFLRVRPLSEPERARGGFECVSVVDRRRLLLVDPDKFSTDPLRQNRAQEREFRFDAVFGPGTNEAEVQELLGAEGLIDSLVRLGRNGTVFAYGPTGTGKTHTMVGSRERPGLMPRMTRALYERLEQIGDRDTKVHISFMEIYNELIRDLLSPERQGPLDLLEDEHGNVQVPHLTRVRAPTSGRTLQLLQEGNARRTQEPTAANSTSSRSHALLQISLWRGQRQRGKLFLIDLAGSERASHTQNQGQRLKEGAAINRSLLALGNVINALSAASVRPAEGGGTRRAYVNYRDSKLTRLLKDSLDGASGGRTVLIAHVTPCSLSYDETFNTLTYASRANNIIGHRMAQPQRPASADRSYSEALALLRREAQRAGRLDANGNGNNGTNGAAEGPQHAASTGQLADDRSSAGDGSSMASGGLGGARIPPLALAQTRKRGGQATGGNGSPNSQQQVRLPRIGGTLFDNLRDQHLANGERQQRLRERLMRANAETYDLEVLRRTRLAILEACGTKKTEDEEEAKFERVAERMEKELAELETKLSSLAESRQRLEGALRRGEQGLRSLETRMRSMARDNQQQQVLELVRSLAQQQAERAAIQSDFAIQSRRIRRQESQLKKLCRYERVAEQLIGGNGAEMDEEERERLRREYRLLRSQLVGMVPSTDSGLPSWNAQMLAREGARRESDWTEEGARRELDKTFTVLRPTQNQQQRRQQQGHGHSSETMPSSG